MKRSMNQSSMRNEKNERNKNGKKKMCSSAIGILLAGSMMLQPAVAAPTTVKVLIDGKPLVTDQAAVIRNGRTMVPFNAIFSALGAQVSWNEKEQKVTGIKNDLTVELFIGKADARVNGLPIKLDAPAQIISSRTMVPLKFVSSNLGADVSWDGVNYIASVNTGIAAAIPDIFPPGTEPAAPLNPPVIPTTPVTPAAPVKPVTPPATPGTTAAPAKDTSAKANLLSGTFVAENLSKEKFVIQFNGALTADIKSLTSQKDAKGTYSVSGNAVTITSNLLGGSFTLEQLKYNGRDIYLLKDAAANNNAVAMTPVPYEDFAKIWAGQKK